MRLLSNITLYLPLAAFPRYLTQVKGTLWDIERNETANLLPLVPAARLLGAARH